MTLYKVYRPINTPNNNVSRLSQVYDEPTNSIAQSNTKQHQFDKRVQTK